MELEVDTRIERLSVDLTVAEEQWQKARMSASSLVMEKESSELTSLKASAYWEHFKAIRTEIENLQKLRKFYQSHRNIRKLFIQLRNREEFESENWQTIIDSAKYRMQEVTEECQWLEGRIRDNVVELKAINKRLSTLTDSLNKDEMHWLYYRKEYMEKQIKTDSLLHYTGNSVLYPVFESYYSSAQESLTNVSFFQRAYDIYRKIVSIWHFEIRNVDGKSVTIGKIVIALLVIIIGIKLAHFFSSSIARMVSKRLSLEVGIIDAGQKLFFYTFSVIFTFYALYSIQVPLTAFALVGGALALGLGFGSQNILNNFISGIILLIERPIKRGDFVEVDGSLGIIESIGLRSTRICTPGNIHMVIPNSSFLEKTVVNWTLADRVVREELQVGVIYGSPTREVKRLLLAAADEVERVLRKPEPIVLFSDFGDNALIFHLLFWIKINNIIERKTILSELRFKVNDFFNTANIVIAFPQRDVHLDTAKPLKVVLDKTD
jgi:small-conductance mechanosensitive channel